MSNHHYNINGSLDKSFEVWEHGFVLGYLPNNLLNKYGKNMLFFNIVTLH